MKLPISDALGIADAVHRAAGDAGEQCCLLVAVGDGAPATLVSALRDAFVPDTTLANVDVTTCELACAAPLSGYDAVLVVVGHDEAVRQLASVASSCGVPCALLVESSVEAPAPFGGDAAGAPVSVIAGSSDEALLGKLALWLSESCRHDVEVAAAFPFVRAAESARLVRSCATTNAAVALVGFLGGADLPVMAANQITMASRLRRVCVPRERAASASSMACVAGCVLACAFGSRAVARRATRSCGPLSPAVRAVVAYAGTVACGVAVGFVSEFGKRVGGTR